ncbi:MAG: hypothetical protein ACOC9Q_03270 [bacterium]
MSLKNALLGLFLVLVLGSWLAPSLLSSTFGSGSRSFSYLRGGYVEQHKTNLTGHWIGTAKGNYESLPFFAFAGETVVIDHDVAVDEGSVDVRIRHYVWDIVPELVWSQRTRDSAAGRFTVAVPQTGFYHLELSYFGFAGSVILDWAVK